MSEYQGHRVKAGILFFELSELLGPFVANRIVHEFLPDHLPFGTLDDVPKTQLPTLVQRLERSILEARVALQQEKEQAALRPASQDLNTPNIASELPTTKESQRKFSSEIPHG